LLSDVGPGPAGSAAVRAREFQDSVAKLPTIVIDT